MINVNFFAYILFIFIVVSFGFKLFYFKENYIPPPHFVNLFFIFVAEFNRRFVFHIMRILNVFDMCISNIPAQI